MESHDHDETMRALLHDAVSDVQPPDRLGEIRRRTREVRRERRWLPVVLGAGVATAAVVAGSVVITQLGDRPSREGPAASPADDAPTTTRATPVYYLGDTPTGARLYREFQKLPDGDAADADRVGSALDLLTTTAGPDDPDYRTFWPGGSFSDVEVEDEVVVTVDDLALDRPAGVPAADARLALQQVVYTAEAVLGDDLPVQFHDDTGPATEVLGVKVPNGTVTRNRQYDTVAPVNISDPTEGFTTDSDFVARGTASDYITSVSWDLRDASDGVVIGGTVSVGTDGQGTLGFPAWTIDPLAVTDLEPGRYVLEVRAQDIGQTSDDRSVFTDTRTVVIR